MGASITLAIIAINSDVIGGWGGFIEKVDSAPALASLKDPLSFLPVLPRRG